jgi:hypothetical protein
VIFASNLKMAQPNYFSILNVFHDSQQAVASRRMGWTAVTTAGSPSFFVIEKYHLRRIKIILLPK